MLVTRPNNKALATEDFINNAEVLKCLEQLNTAFPKDTNPLIVSDVIDQNGNQYVNLVQKGGGVLGVALGGVHLHFRKNGDSFSQAGGHKCRGYQYGLDDCYW